MTRYTLDPTISAATGNAQYSTKRPRGVIRQTVVAKY